MQAPKSVLSKAGGMDQSKVFFNKVGPIRRKSRTPNIERWGGLRDSKHFQWKSEKWGRVIFFYDISTMCYFFVTTCFIVIYYIIKKWLRWRLLQYLNWLTLLKRKRLGLHSADAVLALLPTPTMTSQKWVREKSPLKSMAERVLSLKRRIREISVRLFINSQTVFYIIFVFSFCVTILYCQRFHTMLDNCSYFRAFRLFIYVLY